jgi:alkylation response protein AidB-like acyl-CoA dehydrogenase
MRAGDLLFPDYRRLRKARAAACRRNPLRRAWQPDIRRLGEAVGWISNYPRSSALFAMWRGISPARKWRRKARTGTSNACFRSRTLRQAAALGFGGIYVKEDVGGSALSRLDAAIIFEELAQGCTSTAAYISIHNMAAWMIDALAARRSANASCPSFAHGAFRELLPDRAGFRLGRREPEDPRRARRRHYVLDGSKAFISGGGVSDLYVCMVRTGGAGPKGISCIVGGEGYAGALLRRAGEEARLEIAADRDGDFENCRVPAET